MQDIEILKLFDYIDPPSNLVYSINSKFNVNIRLLHLALTISVLVVTDFLHHLMDRMHGSRVFKLTAIVMCIDV